MFGPVWARHVKLRNAATQKAAKGQAAAAKVACAAAKVEATDKVLRCFSSDMWGMVAERLLHACVLVGGKQLSKEQVHLSEMTTVTADFHALSCLFFTNKMFAKCITDMIRNQALGTQLDGFLKLSVSNTYARSVVHFGRNDYASCDMFKKFVRLAPFMPYDKNIFTNENCAVEDGYVIWPMYSTRTGIVTHRVNAFAFIIESKNNCCNVCCEYTPNTVLGGTCCGKLCRNCEKGNLWTVGTVEKK